MKGMEGPSLVNSGDIVTFTCRYDLGKDAIYSIKWYKEDSELYRYIPTDFPESRIFQGTPGVIVMVRSKSIYRSRGARHYNNLHFINQRYVQSI